MNNKLFKTPHVFLASLSSCLLRNHAGLPFLILPRLHATFEPPAHRSPAFLLLRLLYQFSKDKSKIACMHARLSNAAGGKDGKKQAGCRQRFGRSRDRFFIDDTKVIFRPGSRQNAQWQTIQRIEMRLSNDKLAK